MTCTPSGHREQPLSGSWRAKVYAGKDALSGRELRFRKTLKTDLAFPGIAPRKVRMAWW
jgi:hypothetical protein